jgi:hypothetical protein
VGREDKKGKDLGEVKGWEKRTTGKGIKGKDGKERKRKGESKSG